MRNQPTRGEPIDSRSVVDGTAVFDVAGKKVGTAVQLYPQVGCLVVQKGWFAHERYVPFSLVVSQDDRGLFLNVSKQELKADRWKVPPPSSEMAAAANPSVSGGSQRGVEDPSAAIASP